MKGLKILGVALAAIVVVAALLLAVGVPLGFLTSTIQERVERETGYRLTIAGSTRIGLWPSPNITMSNATLEGQDRDSGSRLTVGSIQADITLASLWSGRPDVTELLLNRPLLSVPLRRERRATAKAPAPAPASPDASAPTIRRIVVNDGLISLFN